MTESKQQGSDLGSVVLRSTVLMSVPIVVQGLALFIAAGSWTWSRAWLLSGLRLLTMLFDIWVLSRINPVLLRERFRGHEGAEKFDLAMSWLMLPTLMAVFCVGGLDARRFGWSHPGAATIWPGLLLYCLGSALVLWVMMVNPYLEGDVRIQEDRGHRVISTGPYRFVRHPMYVGATAMLASYPLILGSLWAYLPVGLFALIYVFRTSMEDRTLREKLAGYAEYSRRTRYRLLPGVW